MTLSAPGANTLGRSARKTGTLSPRDEAILWDMEERFWTSGARAGRAATAKNAVMIFPYPTGILQGDRIWSHLRPQTGWRSVEMTDRSATRHGEIVLLAYHVSAEKADVPIYEALCASTYLHDESKWLRMSHQQTPVT